MVHRYHPARHSVSPFVLVEAMVLVFFWAIQEAMPNWIFGAQAEAIIDEPWEDPQETTFEPVAA